MNMAFLTEIAPFLCLFRKNLPNPHRAEFGFNPKIANDFSQECVRMQHYSECANRVFVFVFVIVERSTKKMWLLSSESNMVTVMDKRQTHT